LPSPKDRQLRDALALFFNQYFHPVHTVEAEHIVLTAGASDAIENIIHAICDDGDSIIAPGPAFRTLFPSSLLLHVGTYD
jgi:aspartate/methionine/tyrosine aminotransferase